MISITTNVPSYRNKLDGPKISKARERLNCSQTRHSRLEKKKMIILVVGIIGLTLYAEVVGSIA